MLNINYSYLNTERRELTGLNKDPVKDTKPEAEFTTGQAPWRQRGGRRKASPQSSQHWCGHVRFLFVVLGINFTIRREEEKETININTIMFIFREKISALIRSLSRVFCVFFLFYFQ